ncbi:MAG: hypothetical protein OHK006_02710 [Thermodesulfovibrionales bacterium]
MGENQDYKAILEFLAAAKNKDALDIVRLRSEVRSEIGAGDRTLGQFLKLLESFQEIIPNERQRYSAALKALSATSGLGLKDLIDAVDAQLSQLKKVEGSVVSFMKEYSDELREMDSRLGSIRAEAAELRERLQELTKEEKELIGVMAAQVKMRKGVEQTAGKVLAEIGAELAGIRNKAEMYSSESAPAAEPPAPAESETVGVPEDIVPEESSGMSEFDQMLAPRGEDHLKKCPMCEGPLNFYADTATWICYTCGHEVAETENNPDTH